MYETSQKKLRIKELFLSETVLLQKESDLGNLCHFTCVFLQKLSVQLNCFSSSLRPTVVF